MKSHFVTKTGALVLLAGCLLSAHPAFAVSQTALAGGAGGGGSAQPFGGDPAGTPLSAMSYSGEYQQFVSSSVFGSGTVQITKVAFSSALVDGADDPFGNLAESITYSNVVIKLATTNVTPTGTNHTQVTTPDTRPGNVGGAILVPNQNGITAVTPAAFSGSLTTNLAVNNTFDVVFTFTTPYTYDTSQGNLVMDINMAGTAVGSMGQADTFQYGPNTKTGTLAYGNGIATPVFGSNQGLLSQFTFAPVVVAPEPSSLVVMFIGGLGLLTIAKRRAAQRQL